MEYQKPAEGILINRDFGDAKFYSVECECGNPDDQLRFEVEADDCGITVHVWTTAKSNWWGDNTWYKRFLRKMSITWKLWTTGYIETESWTILRKQQAFNFAETLKQAIEDVETFQKDKK